MPSDAKVPRDPVNGLVKVKIIEGRVALSPSNLVPLPLLLFFAQASQGVGYLPEFSPDFRLGSDIGLPSLKSPQLFPSPFCLALRRVSRYYI